MRVSGWMATGFLVATVSACGSGGSVQAPEEPGPTGGDLSFAPIAGAWEGPATEPQLGTDFWIRVDPLLESADPGERVGIVGYYDESTDSTPICGGIWNAVAVEGHRYTVHENVTNRPDLCPDGTVVLVHDLANDVLDYRFSPDNDNPDLFAEGELHRIPE